MIRNIVFDMGNVIARYEPNVFLERMPIHKEYIETIRQTVFASVEWLMQDAGALEDDEFVRRVIPRLPEEMREDGLFAYENWYVYGMDPIVEIEELARELKGLGYKLYALTNASTHFRDYYERIPVFGLMDGIFVSAEHKVYKPDHRMYEAFFETFGLKPEECLFIDDSAPNICGAVLCGMDGVVYKDDPELLREELKAKGVLS
ncbi:MAG: HAD family phosphatase [Firmicutes bacterium]|nr:HAD family phosphatase [Bacillota bacterium]